MTDRLSALRLYLRVARTGSFSAAARELGISQPSASRIIAALEQDVGATLLTRTTHAVTLTETGAEYLARVDTILAALDEADYAARGGGELRGLVRLAASSTVIIREILPVLASFLDRHPKLRIELITADHRLDPVGAGVDVAIRFGAPRDSTAVARKLAEAPRVLIAAPAFIDVAGQPVTPYELNRFSILAGPAGRHQDAWTFRRGPETVTVRVEGRLVLSDNESATAAAVAGLGITSGSLWGCRAEIAEGSLIRLLPDWHLGSVEVHALFAAGRAAKPSARVIVDHLRERLRASAATLGQI